MRKPDLYQIAIIVLTVAIIVALGIFIFNLSKGKIGKTAVSVDSVYAPSVVHVNGKEKGETPVYTEEIYAGDMKVDMSGDKNAYSTTLKPAAGTLAVVKRDVGVSDVFSSGQNIWFTKTGGEEALVSVISPEASEVSVIVDGVEVGKTPVKFSTDDLLSQSEDGRYNISFKKDGYENQEVEVKVKPGYELTVRVDMFLKPIPEEINTLTGFPDGIVFIDFSNVDNPAFSDRQAWAKAINYWLETRGAVVFGNTKVEKFNYFIADNGKIYNEEGNEIAPADMTLEAGMYVAYLGDQPGELTEEANNAISEALGKEVVIVSGEGGTVVKIKETGLGFLRVRAGPTTGDEQVGKVDVGSTYPYIGEENGWYNIEYETGQEGWVSGTYAEVIEPEEATEEAAEEDTEETDEAAE